MTGSELDDAALAAVHRRTDGNPFFVIELLRHTTAAHEDRLGDWVHDHLVAVVP